MNRLVTHEIARRDLHAATMQVVEAIETRGRLLIVTHGPGYEHTDPVDRAAVEYWMALTTERLARPVRMPRLSVVPAPVVFTVHTYEGKRVDGEGPSFVRIRRDGVSLTVCEPKPALIAGTLLSCEAGVAHGFDAAACARDFPRLAEPTWTITSDELREWTANQN